MKIINSNDYEMAKFQNVMNKTNFKGASVIKKLHPSKYKNHQKETNLTGFDELYRFVIKKILKKFTFLLLKVNLDRL